MPKKQNEMKKFNTFLSLKAMYIKCTMLYIHTKESCHLLGHIRLLRTVKECKILGIISIILLNQVL